MRFETPGISAKRGRLSARPGRQGELGKRAAVRPDLRPPDDKLKRITGWLEARPDLKSWKVGQEFDLWHGDFSDMEEETEQSNQPVRD